MSSRNGMGRDGLAQAHTPHRHSLLEGGTATLASDLLDKNITSLLPGAGEQCWGWINCWGFPALLSLLFPGFLLLILQLGPSHTILSLLVPKSAVMDPNVPAVRRFPSDPGWDHTCWNSLEISQAVYWVLDVLQRNVLGWFPFFPLNTFLFDFSSLCPFFPFPFPGSSSLIHAHCSAAAMYFPLLPTFSFYVPFALFIHFSCYLFSVILTSFLPGGASFFC